MIQKISFQCEITSPMFMGGADGNSVELRAPSIKGMLRFWWRALHPDLENLDRKIKEMLLFGGGNELKNKEMESVKARKSILKIRVINNIEPIIDKLNLLPHRSHPDYKIRKKIDGRDTKKDPNRRNCISMEHNFEVHFSIRSGDKAILAQMAALFELSCILGGFGKRPRRGMGKIRILQKDNKIISLDHILGLIKIVNPKHNYVLRGSTIELPNPPETKYPFVKCIQIGKHSPKSLSDLLENIGLATHRQIREDESNYARAVGAGRPRAASPVYISFINNEGRNYPIITSLNPQNDGNQAEKMEKIRKSLRNKVIN